VRLRDFASIADILSDREIDELQVAIDKRREARARLGDAETAGCAAEPLASDPGYSPECLEGVRSGVQMQDPA
jgi:hypothetical protein